MTRPSRHRQKHSDRKQQERAAALAKPHGHEAGLNPEEVESIQRHNDRSFANMRRDERRARRAADRTDLPDFVTGGHRP